MVEAIVDYYTINNFTREHFLNINVPVRSCPLL